MASFKGEEVVTRRQTKIVGGGVGFKVYSEPGGGDGMRNAGKAVAMEGRSQRGFGVSKCGDENLGKGRSKIDASGKLKIGRKVLADVSNLKRNVLRKGGADVSAPIDSHKGKNLSGIRVGFVGDHTRDASCSFKKPVLISMKASQSGVSEDLKSLKCANSKNVPANHKSDSVSSDQRKIARKPLVSIRQSLAVNRMGKLIGSSDLKETARSSYKGTRSTVKVKVGRKVVADLSNTKNHLRKSHASKGFRTANDNEKPRKRTWVPGGQGIVDRNAFPNKSLKPLRRSMHTKSTAQTLKSKTTISPRKSVPAEGASSKSDEGPVYATVKDSKFVGSHESSTENLPHNLSVPGIICSRRNSFTSSLIAKDEFQKNIVHHEKLPDIDNIRNHLEVAEYIDEIYHYFWALEAQQPSLANYMVIQTDITPKLRGIMINWLTEVHLIFKLMQETLFLTVALFDKFLSLNTIKRNELQLVGLTSLFLASKYEDLWHPKVEELTSLITDTCTRDKMLAMEKRILKTLKFCLNTPTLHVFMLRFLKAAQSLDKKLGHLAFYLIELSLVEYEALTFKPSLLCASAIYVARCTLRIFPAWTPLLLKHAHYEESELKACATMILRLQKSASKGSLKVTYEKYNHQAFNYVGDIKAVENLPTL